MLKLDVIIDQMLKLTVLYPGSLYFPSHDALGAGGREILGTRLGNGNRSYYMTSCKEKQSDQLSPLGRLSFKSCLHMHGCGASLFVIVKPGLPQYGWPFKESPYIRLILAIKSITRQGGVSQKPIILVEDNR